MDRSPMVTIAHPIAMVALITIDYTAIQNHYLLPGVLSRTKLEEFLTGPPFEVQLHDRDRREDVIKPLPKIFDIHGQEESLFDTSGE